MKTSLTLFTVILSLASSVLYSQDLEKSTFTDLGGRHALYLFAGLQVNSTSSHVRTSTTGTQTGTDLIGAIGYQYWFDNEWSIHAYTGIYNTETNANLTKNSTISIVPILFGCSYYPEFLSIKEIGKVHIGVNTGVFVANGSKFRTSVKDFGTSTINETVLGAEPNAGIDFFLSRRIKIGPVFSYYFVGDFEEIAGRRKNYNGTAFSLHIGLLF